MDRLRTEHLYKKYGKRTVVNDVSIYLEQGEIVGLLGPNGAGKTTALKVISGLHTAYRGSIHVNGKIGHLPSRRGVSPLSFLVFGHTPFSSKVLTFSTRPALTAKVKGVSPSDVLNSQSVL